MHRGLGLVLVALLLLVGGCGGGDGGGAASSAKATTPAAAAPATETNTPTIKQPGEAEATSDVDKVRKALEAKGYTVADDEVSGTPVASLSVADGRIVFYRNTGDASEDAAGIKSALANNPGRGSIRIEGTRVYWVAQERNLTKAERAAFLKLVSIAEGAL